ncbi:hypothetical protein [Streptomyces albicerus]|uniref:hypothetical protein n=1 Tax=Streptomyces albicerus TaxID=2569859 RepID=UPI001788C0D2|nr:hypothetical protein [Streptomyces albicerus]
MRAATEGEAPKRDSVKGIAAVPPVVHRPVVRQAAAASGGRALCLAMNKRRIRSANP